MTKDDYIRKAMETCQICSFSETFACLAHALNADDAGSRKNDRMDIAAKAMQGLLSNSEYSDTVDSLPNVTIVDTAPHTAVQLADALLAELEKTDGK